MTTEQPRTIQLQACARVSLDRLPEAMDRWHSAGLPLGRNLYTRLHTERPQPGNRPGAGVRVSGVVGDVWAQWSIQMPDLEHSDGRSYAAPYTDASWDEFRGLLRQLPAVAELEISIIDVDRGYLISGLPSIRTSTAAWRPPGWLALELAGSPEMLVDDPDGEQALLEFVTSYASDFPLAYAEVSFLRGMWRTDLENSLGLWTTDTIPAAEHTLRGYGWLTVLPATICERLGGAGALRASGRFAQVHDMSGGGCMLLATDHFDQYGMDAASRVFSLLAPVLPPGTPSVASRGQAPYFLVRQDPSKRV